MQNWCKSYIYSKFEAYIKEKIWNGNRIQLNNHFFLAAFLASFLAFPAGALSAASFYLAFFSAYKAAFFFFMIYSFFLIVSASILMVVWHNPQ